MLMAQIRYWSICSSRAKRNQRTPTYSIRLLNIISSLLLLPKTKFPIGKKPKYLNPSTQDIKENKSGTFYEVAYITQVAAESEALLHFPYHSKLIFHRGHHVTIFTSITYFSSFCIKLSICKLRFFTIINKADFIEVFFSGKRLLT